MNNISNSNALDINLEKAEHLLYSKVKQQPLEVDLKILKCLSQINEFKQKLEWVHDFTYDFTNHELMPYVFSIKEVSKEEIIQDKTNAIITEIFTDLFSDKTEANLVIDYLTHDQQAEKLVNLIKINLESSPEYQIEQLKRQKTSLLAGFENFFKNSYDTKEIQKNENFYENIVSEANPRA